MFRSKHPRPDFPDLYTSRHCPSSTQYALAERELAFKKDFASSSSLSAFSFGNLTTLDIAYFYTACVTIISTALSQMTISIGFENDSHSSQV